MGDRFSSVETESGDVGRKISISHSRILGTLDNSRENAVPAEIMGREVNDLPTK